MGVKLVSSGGGSVEINPPATASSYIATMPAGTGTVVVNGVGGSIVSGTAVVSTSGTSIDFTGIPSWVKRITVMFSAVSTNGTSVAQIQLGDGSVKTSGYAATATQFVDAGAVSVVGIGSGFPCLTSNAAGYNLNGGIQICNLSANTWVASGVLAMTTTSRSSFLGGAVTLTGTLDRVRITTVNGTDTFDAGTINILYE